MVDRFARSHGLRQVPERRCQSDDRQLGLKRIRRSIINISHIFTYKTNLVLSVPPKNLFESLRSSKPKRFGYVRIGTGQSEVSNLRRHFQRHFEQLATHLQVAAPSELVRLAKYHKSTRKHMETALVAQNGTL